ncbi:MAG: Rne/Rng family ribonuclease [Bacteroidales bacterium]|nr:Rne/Rng family ribonuclease [Bacteroidales bacterium]
MTTELVVDVQPKEISLAVLEDSRLMEFQKESRDVSFSVGDIFLGRVHKVMPGLNAVFVDVGYEKDAFLHYLDLGPQYKSQQAFLAQLQANRKKTLSLSKFRMQPDIPKEGHIAELLNPGQDILVQIAKEPISTKGPRLTSEISIAGRFLILMPFSDKISISTKIKSQEERVRLKQLLMSITPKGFGVIVRTVAENKRVAELDNELKVLLKRWDDMLQKIQTAQKPPSLIYEETGRTVVLLRDLLNASFEHIYVNSKEVFEEIRDYVSLIMPEKTDIVKLYDKEIPIFDHYGVTKQVKSGLGRVVSIKAGAYLIIEHTEAMHVIDVNSGNRTRSQDGQEANAFEVNMSAADEIARQLRLRDMGGIIVVDFIDMNDGTNRQKLYDRLKEDMANDRAKHNILPLSKFCLMQITRQRVRPQTFIQTAEVCPTCFGKGEIRPSILFTDMLENKIAYLVGKLHKKKCTLRVHPYVAAYIEKGGLSSLKWTWRRKYDLGLRIVPSQAMTYLEYAFFDRKGQEIDMKEEIEIK